MLQVLNKLSLECSDYVIAGYFHIFKRILNMVHLIVPIILMIMIAVSFVQMVVSPDDPQKKKSKSLVNKFIAAVIVFLVPYIMNLIIDIISYGGDFISKDFSFTDCYKESEIIYKEMKNK